MPSRAIARSLEVRSAARIASVAIVLAALPATLAGPAGARAAEAPPLPLFTRLAAPSVSASRLAAPGRGATFAALSPAALATARQAARVRLSLPTGDGALALALARREVFRPNATLTTTDGAGPHPFVTDAVCLAGEVEGEPGSYAVITLSAAGAAMGFVESQGRHWTVSPAGAGACRIQDDALASPAGPPPRCAMDEIAPNPSALELPRARLAPEPLAAGTRYACNLAVDCDYEWYLNRWSANAPAATQYLVAVFGAISLIYERDLGCDVRLGYLNLWTTSADPYTQYDALSQLGEFRTWWNANRQGVTRTVAHLVSGRDLNGGYSYINVLCSDVATGYGYGVTSANGLSTLPSGYTNRDVWLIAHELGHEFGSYHTQSCFWQANGYAPAGTLLDSCYAAEGTCYTGPTGIVPRDKGTIMSYCDQVPGGAQANDRLAFHPACIALMRQQIESHPCMIVPVVQPATQLAAAAIGGSAHLVWTPSVTPGVLRYDVYRSGFPLDPSSARIGSSTGSSYDDPLPWGAAYYRVRAMRSADSSDCSNEAVVSRCLPAATGTFPAGSSPTGMASGDFNGDGAPDLAVCQSSSGRVAVLMGLTSGGSATGTFGAAAYYNVGSSPGAIVAGDWDKDGITDLAVANGSSGTVSILLGNGSAGLGDGTFRAAGTIMCGAVPVAIVSADFNEDGVADLATANGGNATVGILLGDGLDGIATGAFTLTSTISGLGTGVTGLVAADVTGDGITDLVVLRGAGVRVLPGNGSGGKGDGTFGAGGAYAAGGTPSAIAAGDLDGDGVLDLVVANNATPNASISVLLGHEIGGVPDGSFAAHVDYACAVNPTGLAVGDFTGDGRADVALVMDTPLDDVAIYPGLGDGRLGAPLLLDVGGPPRAVLPGDFDGNGVADLVSASRTRSTVSVLRSPCAAEIACGATVTAPGGGELWFAPSEHTLSWIRDPGCVSVNLDLSRDDGAHWERLATNVVGNSYSWTATLPTTDQARLRVSNAWVPTAGGTSATFSIIPHSTDVGAPGAAAALALRRVVPNPASRAISVTFTLPAAGRASLELVDLAGRRVRGERLADAGPGEHALAWRDLDVAPGLYWLRLAQGGRAVTRKVAVVR